MSARHHTRHAGPAPTAVRKGQFLWRDEESRTRYLDALRARIAEGFFFGDSVLTGIVEELAPVLNDVTQREISRSY